MVDGCTASKPPYLRIALLTKTEVLQKCVNM